MANLHKIRDLHTLFYRTLRWTHIAHFCGLYIIQKTTKEWFHSNQTMERDCMDDGPQCKVETPYELKIEHQLLSSMS